MVLFIKRLKFHVDKFPSVDLYLYEELNLLVLSIIYRMYLLGLNDRLTQAIKTHLNTNSEGECNDPSNCVEVSFATFQFQVTHINFNIDLYVNILY